MNGRVGSPRSGTASKRPRGRRHDVSLVDPWTRRDYVDVRRGLRQRIAFAPRQPQSSAETEATSTPPSMAESGSEPGGPLADVGTITRSDEEGTTFSDHYRVGPIIYSKEGTPPEEVLEACNVNYPTLTARSVFASGQVTITYQEGTLPTEVSLGTVGEAVVQDVDNGEAESGGPVGPVAFRAGGEWLCQTSFSLEFQPGESQTLPFWIIARILSNSQPRVPASTLNAWYFNFIDPYYVNHSVIIHGPGTGWCTEGPWGKEQRLFLYNRSGGCAVTTAAPSESTTGTVAPAGSAKQTQAVLSEVGGSGANGPRSSAGSGTRWRAGRRRRPGTVSEG